ncbi:MAG: hypothetical protein VB070_09195 [Clostridiaceae bacterium]|nr:hypothetical protein [Clostridiaceae bacterium]
MFKRITVFALVIAMLALASCASPAATGSSQTVGTTAETAAATSAAATTTQPAEKYTYEIVQGLLAPVEENAPMIKYWEDQFGVDFVIDYVESAKLTEIMPLRFASQEIPDVITNLGYSTFYDLVNEGIAGTWTEEFLRSSAPDIAKHLDELGDDAWAISKHDNGEMFTIPGVNAEYMYGSAIIWRDSWLKKVGESIPKTLADAERVLYKFRNDDPDGNGQKDTYGLSQDGMTQIFGACGAPMSTLFGANGDKVSNWIKDENGNMVYSSVASGAKEALTILAKWYKDGVVDPEFITGENKGGYWAISHAFCNGRIGFTTRGINNHWRLPENLQTGTAAFANQELFMQNYPGETYDFGYPLEGKDGTRWSGFRSYAFWSCFAKKMTDDQGKFAKFLQIIEKVNGYTKPEDYLTARFGIEGTNWDYDANHVPQSKDGFKTAEELTAIGGGTVFTFANNYVASNLLNPSYSEWRDKMYADPERSEVWKNYITRPLPSATDYQSELDKIIDEGYVSIITGEKPVSYFDELVAAWKKAGGDILTQEANDMVKE